MRVLGRTLRSNFNNLSCKHGAVARRSAPRLFGSCAVTAAQPAASATAAPAEGSRVLCHECLATQGHGRLVPV